MDADPYEYFYVAYSTPGYMGAAIIPQHKAKDFDVNPDGLNIASATAWLCQEHNGIVIIIFWKKTTLKRRDDFQLFAAKMTGQKEACHLKLVPNEPPKRSD